jgi:4-alpha-glucanotransferase
VGNGLLVSPELLIEDGLLRRNDCTRRFSSTTIDYHAVIPFKHKLLETAWTRFRTGARRDLVPAYEEFCHARSNWLDDYGLFRALKSLYHDASYLSWPAELVQRVPSALERARRDLADQIDQVRLAQFLLFRQGQRLKEYARAKGVRLIGDLPFFVSPDSSDVWTNPELFLLDAHRRPQFVAGVPPDYFSAQGQLWGNPVYHWERLRQTGFAWWIERIRALLAHVDVIRLDHFRAFAAAWHVPAEAPTAEIGQWVAGPGAEFFRAVCRELGALPFIAEDLGLITPDVSELRDQFNVPGTRVLQFAFDGSPANPHLPGNYPANTAVYTGTHDNATTREWFQNMPARERRRVWKYLGKTEGPVRDIASELIRLAWSSRAALALAPLQDLLNLGPEGRMNVPGQVKGNWRWRATEHMLAGDHFRWLKELTERSNRATVVTLPTMETTA